MKINYTGTPLRLRERIKPSLNTNKSKSPACPHASRCGGCSYQGLSYEAQLAAKQHAEEKLLSSFAVVSPIIGMDYPYYYRNKVHAAFAYDSHRRIICGSYEAGSHRIVNTSHCLIEDKRAGEIIAVISELAESFKIKIYDEDRRTGLLRHVLIRTGHTTGQILVVLVMASTFFPSKNNFIKELLRRCPDITSIVININSRRTSMILGDRQNTEYGRGYIEDTLLGIKYRISPRSFYQINPVQTEKLYQNAIRLAMLSGSETILDAYSGIGTIGMTAAAHAANVISVETSHDAVLDARLNARNNNINNIHIYEKDAGQFMIGLADRHTHIDVVFMDPPRAGSDRQFLHALLTLRPGRIIYISCNPETLARDLKILTRQTYKAVSIQPVDMFPWTGGIETIAALELC